MYINLFLLSPLYNVVQSPLPLRNFLFEFVCLFVFSYSGFLSGISMFGTNTGVAVFMIIIGALFSCLAAICFVMLIKVSYLDLEHDLHDLGLIHDLEMCINELVCDCTMTLFMTLVAL